MAKLDSPNSFKTEDFPNKYQDLIGKLFFVLNGFMTQVINALAGKLNYVDNFDCIDTEFEVTAPVTSATVRNTLNRPIRGSSVLRVDNLSDTSANLSGAPFIELTNLQGQVKINNITGLHSGDKYRIRAVFYP